MPLYKYRCSGCGHVFDTIQSFDKVKDIWVCKKCASPSHRAPSGNSVAVMDAIDTGVAGRSFDRPADIERIMAEREIIHDANNDAGDWDDSDFGSLDE